MQDPASPAAAAQAPPAPIVSPRLAAAAAAAAAAKALKEKRDQNKVTAAAAAAAAAEAVAAAAAAAEAARVATEADEKMLAEAEAAATRAMEAAEAEVAAEAEEAAAKAEAALAAKAKAETEAALAAVETALEAAEAAVAVPGASPAAAAKVAAQKPPLTEADIRVLTAAARVMSFADEAGQRILIDQLAQQLGSREAVLGHLKGQLAVATAQVQQLGQGHCLMSIEAEAGAADEAAAPPCFLWENPGNEAIMSYILARWDNTDEVAKDLEVPTPDARIKITNPAIVDGIRKLSQAYEMIDADYIQAFRQKYLGEGEDGSQSDIIGHTGSVLVYRLPDRDQTLVSIGRQLGIIGAGAVQKEYDYTCIQETAVTSEDPVLISFSPEEVKNHRPRSVTTGGRNRLVMLRDGKTPVALAVTVGPIRRNFYATSANSNNDDILIEKMAYNKIDDNLLVQPMLIVAWFNPDNYRLWLYNNLGREVRGESLRQFVERMDRLYEDLPGSPLHAFQCISTTDAKATIYYLWRYLLARKGGDLDLETLPDECLRLLPVALSMTPGDPPSILRSCGSRLHTEVVPTILGVDREYPPPMIMEDVDPSGDDSGGGQEENSQHEEEEEEEENSQQQKKETLLSGDDDDDEEEEEDGEDDDETSGGAAGKPGGTGALKRKAAKQASGGAPKKGKKDSSKKKAASEDKWVKLSKDDHLRRVNTLFNMIEIQCKSKSFKKEADAFLKSYATFCMDEVESFKFVPDDKKPNGRAAQYQLKGEATNLNGFKMLTSAWKRVTGWERPKRGDRGPMPPRWIDDLKKITIPKGTGWNKYLGPDPSSDA